MRRTQLYLEFTTVSESVRKATRERYVGNRDERKRAMQAFVGIRPDEGAPGSEEIVRQMRRGDRLKRLDR